MEKQIKDIDREINKRLYLAEESIKTLAELAYEVAAECKIYAEEISFLKDLKNKKNML